LTTHIKRVTSIVLAMVLSFSMLAISAFAKTPDDVSTVGTTVNVASTKSSSYGNVWLNTGGSGSFKVHSDISGKTYFTIKIESNSNNSWANLRIQRPDGLYLTGKDLSLNSGNPEKKVFILKGIPGDYTIYYDAGTDQGMRIMCWIY